MSILVVGSVALDSSDKVHISYRDSINDALKYATNSFGSWTIETVASESASNLKCF